MCDFQVKLVAWLDRELPVDEALEVARHVQRCRECRSECETFDHVNRTFEAYCDAVMAARTYRGVPRWIPALSGSLVAVALLLAALPRAPVELPPVRTQTVAPVPDMALAPRPAPRKAIHRRHVVPPVQERAAKWQPAQPAVQIAIPAETMLPPGALPQGMNFIAELSIGPDGSVERVRLRP
jgi:hypothetical protein